LAFFLALLLRSSGKSLTLLALGRDSSLALPRARTSGFAPLSQPYFKEFEEFHGEKCFFFLEHAISGSLLL